MTREEQTGEKNDKIADSDIQGENAGERNKASTEAGNIPPPAGEVRVSEDPRLTDSRRER
jgi:hypothetical protein